MKKCILSILGISTMFVASAQKINYKVGLMTALPANVTTTHVAAGSTMLEASKTLGKSSKYQATLNTGYVRLSVDGEAKISQIPVLVGARYSVNPNWYFGGCVGVTIPTKKSYGNTEFGYSPYIGYQKGHISVDGRYYLSGLQTPTNTMSLVFSYSL